MLEHKEFLKVELSTWSSEWGGGCLAQHAGTHLSPSLINADLQFPQVLSSTLSCLEMAEVEDALWPPSPTPTTTALWPLKGKKGMTSLTLV